MLCKQIHPVGAITLQSMEVGVEHLFHGGVNVANVTCELPAYCVRMMLGGNELMAIQMWVSAN